VRSGLVPAVAVVPASAAAPGADVTPAGKVYLTVMTSSLASGGVTVHVMMISLPLRLPIAVPMLWDTT
jgi:hypothetical protein